MTLAPFQAAPSPIQIHLAAVAVAALLGAWILLRPKGTAVHRLLGRTWMVLMVIVALSSFLIPATIGRFLGPFGVIHVLSLGALVSIAMAIRAARSGRIRAHRIWVTATYLGAIGGAGAGAFAPGRLISQMLGHG
jgi:uncharacterized membrane protein